MFEAVKDVQGNDFRTLAFYIIASISSDQMSAL